MTEPYSHLSLHRWMLRDRVRNEAYRKAITQAVAPGQVVLDIGAGTGILSVFAAQAGASKVYAVERTGIASVARRMMEANGVAARVQVLESDLEDIDLPEKVDVIMSEWMGGLGVDENMLAPLVMARDRWLKPGGKMIPERVTAFLAPAWIEDFDEDIAYWRTVPHGVDMSVIAELAAHEAFMSQAPLRPEDLLAAAQPLWTHDAYTCSLAEADRAFESRLTFTTARSGKLSGLAAWFSADMSAGSVLTNAVGAPDTHWGRFLFPLTRTVDVAAGTAIEVEFRCEATSPGSCEFYWAVQIGDLPEERHDSGRKRG
jgi:predicted RNA methylase